MLIVADENIPLLDEFFAAFGEIRRYPGRAIDAAAVREADVLLVRSVTRVDRQLLAGSNVRFVGTCTIGTDHLDLGFFAAAGIAWASAPGCNARGVVDYVLGSVLALAEAQGVDPACRRYGIVGAGQVGSRLVAVLRGLGWSVQVCDPPRQAAEGGDFVSLERILADCDVISLHTPLTRETRHLVGACELSRMRPGSWLINASRGAVLDNPALRQALQDGAELQVVLDVWEGEPLVDAALAQLCRIATPHIAGYSLDGKLRGTAQIYQAFCAWQQTPPTVDLQGLLPRQPLAEITLDATAAVAWALPLVCRAVYDPRRDDADFRRSLAGGEQARRAAFDQLRKAYPLRREIDGLRVRLQGGNPALAQMLEALGVSLV
ncbi:4-phosphoerythronate dehydrogenase PdxB [Pseudomonas sp. N040]|uniref:4-phosphoerythronate dehydrogenase PdxB n=1 Tax=Pseudomonas sp. N040 TaxID=2785325 RepID=UPI0018A2C493|nr:4-phosphoerythronate dehydrogenase PdxB [Pseudomonas sp. N040]MBF7730809.1 4-phosphoerythronate dehydrogenase PdxB [Pseudomonas sp. N040]MBW7014452.1 4-phosphoerythronate dehydrogenase PdxB [Pseudomonas sp. N040]